MAQVTIQEGLSSQTVPDSWINGEPGMEDTNYDPDVTDQLRVGEYILHGGVGPTIARALLKFDTSVIPSGATIDAAKLRFRVSFRTATATGYVNRLTTTDWVEGQVTWNERYAANSWGTPGGDFTTTNRVSFTSPGALGDWDIPNMKTLVEDAIANRSNELHVLIKMDDESAGVSRHFHFDGGELGTQADRPRLIVDYTGDHVVVVNEAMSIYEDLLENAIVTVLAPPVPEPPSAEDDFGPIRTNVHSIEECRQTFEQIQLRLDYLLDRAFIANQQLVQNPDGNPLMTAENELVITPIES